MSEPVNITSLPATVNHTIYQGDTFEHVVLLKEDGVLIDVDGDEFEVNVVDPRGTAVIDLAVGTGIEIVDTGQIKYTFADSETVDFPVNCELRYHFRWLKADGTTKTLEVGKIKVVASI